MTVLVATSVTRTPRWVIVVRHDQRALFSYLRQRFEGIPLIEVVLDRRRADRRLGRAAMKPERRRAERREPPSLKERDRWRGFGYLVSFQAAPRHPEAPSG